MKRKQELKAGSAKPSASDVAEEGGLATFPILVLERAANTQKAAPVPLERGDKGDSAPVLRQKALSKTLEALSDTSLVSF